MRFGFTDEQLELRAALRQVLERECTPADVRAAYAAVGTAPARDRWRVLAELGVPGILVPEAAGGLGLDEVDLVGVLEEAGRVALPEPIGLSAGVAAPVLAAVAGGAGAGTGAGGAGAGTGAGGRAEGTSVGSAGPAEVGQWLARLGSGNAIVAVGGIETTAEGVRATTVPRTAAAPARTPRVVAATWADAFLLAVDQPEAELHLVAADRLDCEPTPTLDPTRRLGTVHWTPGATTCVASGADAHWRIAEIAQRTALVYASELLGLADAMIEQATAYARARQQFGKPIGSFQAVKHHLANARVRLEFARPALYRAAWSMRHDPSAREHDCSMALAMAADAGDLAARVALQVHGAIGYTWECDLHLWMKRAWALSAAGEAAPVHRARVLASALAREGRE